MNTPRFQTTNMHRRVGELGTGLTMLSVVILVALCTAIEAEFVRNPESVTVNEGDNVTLTCEETSHYDAQSSCSDYIYYWRRNTPTASGEYLTNCISVESDFNERMTVTKDGGLYTLNIHKVRPEDTGYYSCYIFYSGFYDDYMYYSDTALLTVNALPSYPPSCEVLPRAPSVGMTVELRCQLSWQDPPSPLTWFVSKSGQIVSPEPTGPTDPGEYFTVNLQITERDNNKEFTCVAGRDRDKGPRCIITPLRVPTIVSIFPIPSLTVYEGEVASFRCESESIPAAEEYRWRLHRDNDSEVKVNMNTLPSQGETYRLSANGQDLQITDVTVSNFNNTMVRCIAINSLESKSSGESLLIVVAMETTTKGKPVTTASKGRTDISSGGGGTGTGIIVGGVLGVILLLVLIAGLGLYIARNRHKPQFVGARFQNSPGHERVGMSVVQASPTYEELPQDTNYHIGQLDRSWSLDDKVHAQSHLYASPDEARREEARSNVSSSPTYANSSGYANLPRSHSQEKRVSNSHSPYAVPDKRDKSRPDPVGSEVTEAEPLEDPKLKNVEGLVYADLDLQRPQAANKENEQPDNPINYASIRGDMAEIRGLLSRK